ncbi:MAG: glycosyltransferase family 2 protein [Lachnospiraceae bacterium]
MIEILMASYNGEKFIGEQIQSILDQTSNDWHLTICDDCSKDNTLSVAKSYAERYPNKIMVKSNKKNSGSASANFFQMLVDAAGSDYVMLSDQDDVWLPDKVKLSMLAMKKMENKYGKKTPLLVHSDLIVADENLNTMENSMFYRQNLKGTELTFASSLCQNSVTGCTIIVNKALLSYLNRKPEHMIMHDWWLALIAVSMGHIGFISTPLIRYRQHGGNQEGAKDFRSASATIEMAGKKEKIRHSLMLTYKQAQDFQKLFGGKLGEQERETLAVYCNFPDMSKIKKLSSILEYGFTKTGLNRKIGYWLYV